MAITEDPRVIGGGGTEVGKVTVSSANPLVGRARKFATGGEITVSLATTLVTEPAKLVTSNE